MKVEINEAKKVLAFECTKLVHGEEEAEKAQIASAALFEKDGLSDEVPTFIITHAQLDVDSRLLYAKPMRTVYIK